MSRYKPPTDRNAMAKKLRDHAASIRDVMSEEQEPADDLDAAAAMIEPQWPAIFHYALRHVATGKLMPLTQSNRGYSWWSPTSNKLSAVGDGLDQAIPNSVRLFHSAKAADNARVAWARGNAVRSYISGDVFGEAGEDYVTYKDVGRKKDDLVVVKYQLVEVL